MTESQLAYSITHPNILEFERRRARDRQATSTGGSVPQLSADRREADPGRVSKKLADKAGVGRRSIERAIAVRENGIPEVNEAVASGEVSLNLAEKIVRLSPAAPSSGFRASQLLRPDGRMIQVR